MLAAAFVVISVLASATAFVTYDCGSPKMNVTTVSLLEVDDCRLNVPYVGFRDVKVQLMQVLKYKEATVRQCKVEISRDIFHCGLFSHLSPVPGGHAQYLEDISDADCRTMFDTKSYKLGFGQIVRGLVINNTVTHPVVLAGTIKDSSCTGAALADPYGSWKDVVAQGTIRITMHQYQAYADLDRNKIILRSGQRCDFNKFNCIDTDGGRTFWVPVTQDRDCAQPQLGLLYEGPAVRFGDAKHSDVIKVATQHTTFALKLTKEVMMCGYQVFLTEDPKLFIREYKGSEGFTMAHVPMQELDLVSYVNTKFVYVVDHIKVELEKLYENVQMQNCKLERKVLQSSLSMAYNQPDEFAYNLMKGPGYFAMTSGEVIHIVKCIPTEVTIRHTEECYLQLPVTRDNSSYFVSPKSRVLQKAGTQIMCNNFMPTMYKLHDGWYKLMPKPTEARSPNILKPDTALTWKYTDMASLAVSGIYTYKDLESLREHIMFPQEREAILNTVARKATGMDVQHDAVSIIKFLDASTLKHIANNSWGHLWDGLLSLDNLYTRIFVLVVVVYLMKCLSSYCINGKQIHGEYGWSGKMLASFSNGVTNYMMNKRKHKEPRGIQGGYEDPELGHILDEEMVPLEQPAVMYLPPNSPWSVHRVQIIPPQRHPEVVGGFTPPNSPRPVQRANNAPPQPTQQQFANIDGSAIFAAPK